MEVYAVVKAVFCPSCNPEVVEALFRTELAARAWIATQNGQGRFHVETMTVQES